MTSNLNRKSRNWLQLRTLEKIVDLSPSDFRELSEDLIRGAFYAYETQDLQQCKVSWLSNEVGVLNVIHQDH